MARGRAGGRPGALARRRADPGPAGRLRGTAVRWCRRKPLIAGLILAVVISLLGGMGAASFFAKKAVRSAEEAESNAQKFRRETERADREAEHAKDILARSLFEQVLAQSSIQPGRRERALQLLREAHKLAIRQYCNPSLGHRRLGGRQSGPSAKLPPGWSRQRSRRTLADAGRPLGPRPEPRPESNAAGPTPDGLLAAAAWYELDPSKLLKGDKSSREGVQVVDLATGQPIARWEVPYTGIPGSFRGTISPDKKLIATAVSTRPSPNSRSVFAISTAAKSSRHSPGRRKTRWRCRSLRRVIQPGWPLSRGGEAEQPGPSCFVLGP